MKTIKQYQDKFNKEFPDPMTKKYGKGIALYCSFCAGQYQQRLPSFIKQAQTASIKEFAEEIEKTILENSGEIYMDCKGVLVVSSDVIISKIKELINNI